MSAATWQTVRSDSDSLSTQKTVNLKEVEVKASHTVQKGDRTKITITRDMRRGTHSIGELLGKEPNFFYNVAFHSLTYNNSSNIVLMVDSVEKDLSTLDMQHLKFDYIEVVDHPTGRYQGYEALINLHTKADYEGYEGYLYQNTGVFLNKYHDDPFYNTMANFAYTKNKLTFSVCGHYYAAKGKYTQWFEQYYKQNGLRNTIINPNGDKNNTFDEPRAHLVVSSDYKFDKYRSISFVYRYDGAWTKYSDHENVLRSYDDEREDETVGIKSSSFSQNNEHALGLYFHDNSSKVKYSANVYYRYVPKKNYSQMEETTGFSTNNYFRDRMHYMSYGLDGWTRLGKNEELYLGAGYVGTWKSYLRRDRNTHAELNSNSYLRNRVWGTTSYSFTPKMTLSATGWIELVHSKSGTLKDNTLPFGGNMMYFVRLTKTKWIRFNYDCNVAYPDQGMSSDYAYFTDSLTMNTGNPLLKSNVTHNFRLWFDAWNCFNVQTGVTLSPHSFNYLADMAEGTLPTGQYSKYVKYAWQNTNYRAWWVSASLTKWFSKYLVYKADVKYTLGKSSWNSYTNRGKGVDASTSLNFYWPKQHMTISFYYEYKRNFNISPQSHSKYNFEFPDLHIIRWFFKDQLEVDLDIRSFFKFFHSTAHNYVDSPALFSHSYNNNNARQRNNIVLHLRYRFSGGKSVRQFNKEMSDEK
jgi:hypothetical protein